METHARASQLIIFNFRKTLNVQTQNKKEHRRQGIMCKNKKTHKQASREK